MGVCDTWNVEINILVYENEMFSLPAEFYFNNWLKVELPMLLKAHLLKHMTCYVPQASRIETSGTIATETFFSGSNLISPILVTILLGNKW